MHFTRRAFALSTVSAPLWAGCARAAAPREVPVTEFGAKPDGTTVNTVAIQSAIDAIAKQGGGTVIVPAGIFVTGALFLKPRVHLRLEKGSVLRCSPDMKDFPRGPTRIQGKAEPSFTPALINADGCDGLRITGAGVLDGVGRPRWDLFWKLRNAAPDPANFDNLAIDRARLAFIQNSKGVIVDGITFKDSQIWNLHLYRCSDVQVRSCRFEVPDDYVQAPSTDGIDLDSCQRVTVDGCYFSVTDDCIAAKGSKGPKAPLDTSSPPVIGIRVRNCHFRRGHQAFSCGSEATVVRDVVIENCRVTGAINVLMLKLRPDTPQLYEDIHVRNLTLDHDGGRILLIEPWSQYKDLDGQAPPKSTVRNISIEGVRGRFGAFGIVRPNPGQTDIQSVLLRDIDVRLDKDERLLVSGTDGVRFDHVVVNGKSVTQPSSAAADAPAGGYRVTGQ